MTEKALQKNHDRKSMMEKHDRKSMTEKAFPKVKLCFVEIRRDESKNIKPFIISQFYYLLQEEKRPQ